MVGVTATAGRTHDQNNQSRYDPPTGSKAWPTDADEQHRIHETNQHTTTHQDMRSNDTTSNHDSTTDQTRRDME
jgi:hypothetical protein